MRWVILFISILICLELHAQQSSIRRVCPQGFDNTIFYNTTGLTGCEFKYILLYEKKGESGIFKIIDTIRSELANQYTHVNATAPLSEPNSIYFLERVDSCINTISTFSDTIKVDIEPPLPSELDSVSVDYINNRVLLGWQRNKTPDFDKYLLYVLVNGFFVAMNPSETIDTFATDLGTRDPKTGSFTYTINTRDSCGRLPAFEKRHSTIYLSNSVDTCKKTVSLTWSHYIGWNTIKSYEIFCSSNNGPFVSIGTTSGTTNSFISSIVLGTSYRYYVRAFKDTTIIISSSSNITAVNTRLRNEPNKLIISSVGSNAPGGEELTINVLPFTNSEIKALRCGYFTNASASNYFNINLSDVGNTINLGLSDRIKYNFFLEITDLCDQTIVKSDTSTNMVLTGKETNAIKALDWNPYSTWNNGVETYITYRGTGNNNLFSLLNWKTTIDTTTTDTETLETVGNEGECYQIEAKENNSNNTSKSNIFCFALPDGVYVPNAFFPNGINRIFKPRGTNIEEEKSEILIWSRWGSLVFRGTVKDGWNGIDINNDVCADGLYVYQIIIINEITNEKSLLRGTVTLLR